VAEADTIFVALARKMSDQCRAKAVDNISALACGTGKQCRAEAVEYVPALTHYMTDQCTAKVVDEISALACSIGNLPSAGRVVMRLAPPSGRCVTRTQRDLDGGSPYKCTVPHAVSHSK